MKSRLEVLIERMSAQRDHLDFLFNLIAKEKIEGLVLEIGLGSGRTFDHIRKKIPNYEIFAFDDQVDHHPGCAPDEKHLVLGPILDTLPKFASRYAHQCAFIHCDIGTQDREHDKKIYSFLMEQIFHLAKPGAFIASDREMNHVSLEKIATPAKSGSWEYFSYRVAKSNRG